MLRRATAAARSSEASRWILRFEEMKDDITAARMQMGARAIVSAVSFQDSTNMRYKTMQALRIHCANPLYDAAPPGAAVEHSAGIFTCRAWGRCTLSAACSNGTSLTSASLPALSCP